VTVASGFQPEYAARRIVLSLKEGNAGRALGGLAFGGCGELHRVALSYVRKDVTPHPLGLTIIVR